MPKRKTLSKNRKKADIWNEVGYKALRIAFIKCEGFTVRDFFEETGMEITPAVREKLNRMVSEGELKSQLTQNERNRYEKVYFAQLTMPMLKIIQQADRKKK